jgi:DNA excision repair protein ERCC-4
VFSAICTIQAIVDVMNACLSELRSSRRGELDHVTLESSFFRSFDSNIKRDLGPQWHKVSAHTKQLISDVSILRSLNSYLLRYDCVTFYRYLLAVRAARKSTSLWLLTDAAETLFALAKKRVYTVSNIEVRHSASASISQSDSTLLNPLLKAASSTFRAPSQPAESKPTAKTKPNVSVTDSNSSVGVAANSTHLEAEIELVLEENPKWNLLIDILDEIRVERDKMLTEYHKCNEPILIDDDESSDDVVVVDDESSGKLHLVPGPTLLITKEERSGDQIRNYLERGGACLLSENWRNFLVSQRIHEHPLGTFQFAPSFSHQGF